MVFLDNFIENLHCTGGNLVERLNHSSLMGLVALSMSSFHNSIPYFLLVIASWVGLGLVGRVKGSNKTSIEILSSFDISNRAIVPHFYDIFA